MLLKSALIETSNLLHISDHCRQAELATQKMTHDALETAVSNANHYRILPCSLLYPSNSFVPAAGRRDQAQPKDAVIDACQVIPQMGAFLVLGSTLPT